MYVPQHFAATDDQIGTLLSAPIAGDLITPTADGLQATLLPWLHLPDSDGPGRLQAHLARNNPHWQAAPVGESLVILITVGRSTTRRRGSSAASCGRSSASS